jgi:hypothetical protein
MALTSTLIDSANTNKTVYTSSAVSPVLGNAITSIIICNTSASTTSTFTLHAVPNAGGSQGTASVNNMIINAITIPPTETVSLDQEKLVLSNNDLLIAKASVANVLTVTVSTLAV